jgi:hypothetical protein
VGGAPTLAGELLAAGELPKVGVVDRAADGRLGGVEVGGELGDAPTVIDKGVQAGAEVSEAQPSGLLVEVMAATVDDGEAAVDGQSARQGYW